MHSLEEILSGRKESETFTKGDCRGLQQKALHKR